jgi:hypothetical protein
MSLCLCALSLVFSSSPTTKRFVRPTRRNSRACTRLTDYTGEERGDCFSTYLYAVHQLDHTRQHFNATASNALAHGVSSVVPTLCLGCGFVQNFEGHSFSFNHNYSQHYSWVLGAELNDPKYGADPQRFAAYDLATHITLFPGPFGYSGKPEAGGREHPTGPPELGNNTGLDHFVSYVLGAAGVRRLG